MMTAIRFNRRWQRGCNWTAQLGRAELDWRGKASGAGTRNAVRKIYNETDRDITMIANYHDRQGPP